MLPPARPNARKPVPRPILGSSAAVYLSKFGSHGQPQLGWAESGRPSRPPPRSRYSAKRAFAREQRAFACYHIRSRCDGDHGGDLFRPTSPCRVLDRQTSVRSSSVILGVECGFRALLRSATEGTVTSTQRQCPYEVRDAAARKGLDKRDPRVGFVHGDPNGTLRALIRS